MSKGSGCVRLNGAKVYCSDLPLFVWDCAAVFGAVITLGSLHLQFSTPTYCFQKCPACVPSAGLTLQLSAVVLRFW